MDKLKRVVIKEELVVLTGDYISAIVLNQFLYWSDRVRDLDKLVEEEKEIAGKEGKEINVKPKNGWIYKKSSELIEETMLSISVQSMRRYIKALVEKEYLYERENPEYKWNRTLQYRVNFKKIEEDLNKKGYHLEGYRNGKFSNFQNGNSMNQNGNSMNQNGNSNVHDGRAIPEITPEITSKSTTKSTHTPPTPSRGNEYVKEETYKKIVELYNQTSVSLVPVQKLNTKRKDKLDKLLEIYELEDFGKVFKNAEESDFLKGITSNNGWKANFDWIIGEAQFLRILEGAYQNRPNTGYKDTEEDKKYGIWI